MDIKVKEIRKIVEGHLPDRSFFIVDVQLKGKRGTEKVVVLVDGDNGISIDTCAKLSRSVSEELELMDVFEGGYTLEVSSPGIDFPLSSERQYLKNVGRQLKVELVSGDTIKGKLIGSDASGITIKVKIDKKKEAEDLFIPFSDIKKSKVLVAFK